MKTKFLYLETQSKLCNLFCRGLVILVLCYSNSIAAQQPSQQEIEKLLREAKEQLKGLTGDSIATQKLKELEGNEKQLKDILKNNPTANAPAKLTKFPARQSKLLSTLPKKILMRQEVQSFASSLFNELKKYFKVTTIQSAEKIIAKLNKDPFKISEAAIFCWYKNAPEQSTLLAVYAAAINQDDNILNNCGAVLNLGGLEAKALPILKSALPENPKNSTLLNNIGQAFAGLGEKDSAMVYLMSCMVQSPNHPDACATAAYIEREKGNIEKAKEYLKKSLEAAYNEPSRRTVKFLDPEFKLSRFAKPRVKVPEYFNIHKYLPFPMPCNSVEDVPRAKAEYKEYVAMLDEAIAKFKKMERESSVPLAEMSSKITTGYAVQGGIMRTPFYKFFTEMNAGVIQEQGELAMRYNEEAGRIKAEMKKLDEQYAKEIAAINKLTRDRINEGCCGEGNTSCCIDYEIHCTKLKAVANKYLPKYAVLTRDLQLKVLHPLQNFNEIAFWNYLTYSPVPPKPMGMYTFRAAFYGMAIGYLGTLRSVAQTKLLIPCKEPPVTTADKRVGGELKEPECPLDISIPFIVGKMKLNCEAFDLELNLGTFALDIEKGFEGRPSTLAIGVGIIQKIPVIIKGGLQEQLFITFDGNNNISDFGIQQVAKVNVPFVVDEKAGWKLGVNSGWDFNEGPFKAIADKMFGIQAEAGGNKNLNSYKPKS